jgi:type VI protein secretion system component Hcp
MKPKRRADAPKRTTMSDCFLMIGSPGKTQVRGLHRGDHHAGWLEIESFGWVSPPQPQRAARLDPDAPILVELVLTRKTDQVSPELMMHSVSGTWFDVIVLDVWDRVARKSKVKFHFAGALITSFTTSASADTFSINFESMKMAGAAGAQTTAPSRAAIQFALGQAAR